MCNNNKKKKVNAKVGLQKRNKKTLEPSEMKRKFGKRKKKSTTFTKNSSTREKQTTETQRFNNNNKNIQFHNWSAVLKIL